MSLRVMIVDDNRELAENIAEILQEEGHVTHVAGSPDEALVHARKHEFDVAVIDVRMPGMDGVTLHSELARLRPCATFLLMTAYTRDERIEQALAAGVRTVLPKPVPVDELLGLLPASAGQVEVLVVEDDPDLGAALAEALAEHGYRARCASTLETARRFFEERPAQAVVADIRLPDGDGSAFAREIIESSDVPVVLMTAFETDEAESIVRQYYGKRGKLLTKPFSTESLLEALAQIGDGSS